MYCNVSELKENQSVEAERGLARSAALLATLWENRHILSQR